MPLQQPTYHTKEDEELPEAGGAPVVECHFVRVNIDNKNCLKKKIRKLTFLYTTLKRKHVGQRR